MIKLITLLLGFFLASCSTIPFEESKVEVLQLNQAIEGKDIYNKDFIDFLEIKGYEKSLPITSWGIQELLIAQYYFNYDIKTYKHSINWIKDNEKIALLKPLNSIGLEIGRGVSNEELSKNIFGGGFSFTFERANKRLIRHEVAFNETQYALLKYENKIWELRTSLIEKIVNFVERQDLIAITREELKLKHSILRMIKKRVNLGVLSQLEFDRTAIELKKINQSLLVLQFHQDNLKKEIATNIGLSIEKFNLIPINTRSVKELFEQSSLKFLDKNTINDIQLKATTNSKKLRILLAEYAISESKLKYEIVKQNPDFTFSPAYTYDFGNYIWSLGIDAIISSKERNEIFINKAKKIRSAQGSKVIAYQLEILNEAKALLDGFNYSTELNKENKKIRNTKDKLRKQLLNRFDSGILDRLELELELINFYEIEKDYHKSFYNVIKKCLDAESVIQEPIFTKRLYK